MSLRDLTEDDLDVLFEIQADSTARHMAAFIGSDPGDRESYRARWRTIIADDTTVTKAVVHDGEIVGSVGSFVVDGDTEVTYWVRREVWGQGVASAALAELLRQVTERPLHARVAADNAASARVLTRNGFTRVGAEVSYAEARHEEIEEHLYRLDTTPR
ncbi:GNAT family N-acetyltransferase [Myceligenerans indicum]|nr:GNAT family N-acetyltransferase [Myceligenerans indicum]